MLGNKRILAELTEIKLKLDSIEKLLAWRDKIEVDPSVVQFIGEDGLYSYKSIEEKLKDKYLKRHN